MSSTVNILAVGDICGASGFQFFTRKLLTLKKYYGISFTVVNGENASVNGVTPDEVEEMLHAGADVVTLGNHTFGKPGIGKYLTQCDRVLRPANLGPRNPGRGCGCYSAPFGEICVMNLIGRCGMNFGPDNPFFAAERLLSGNKAKFVLCDFHAEATSEKLAMAYFLDGKLSALWGTHTHVQTSDARVFPKGTGYITDLGMTGPEESVLGIRPEQSINLFLNNPPQRYESAPGPCKLEGAVFTLDTDTGRCTGVEPVRIK